VRSDAADNEYGNLALITPNTAYLDTSYATFSGQIYSCGCGGVAYVGVFGRTSPDGLTDTAALSIGVINQPPVALGNSSAISGAAPLSVDFTADATHTYTSSGTFGATLTVTDNLGGDSTLAAATIDVTQPSVIDSVTSADVFIAGTILRSHTATHAFDGTSQEITQRESGGKKNSRYSYAQHSWQVSVPAGNSTVSVNGYTGPSGDGETFRLAYSFGAQSGLVGTLSGSTSKVKDFNRVALQWSDASSTYTVLRGLSSQPLQ
jgi:PKD repeat protein